jgi:hypothetical protein
LGVWWVWMEDVSGYETSLVRFTAGVVALNG